MAEIEKSDSWVKNRLFKKPDKKFKAYVESTTAHGIPRIFTGKSYTRRVFWLVVVLAAAAGCLYNISDRIALLASQPTSTSVTTERRQVLDFPAVTICNLNRFRRSVLDELADGFDEAITDLLFAGVDRCEYLTDPFSTNVNISDISLQNLTERATLRLDKFITYCQFEGRDCYNNTEDWTPVLTRLGLCYTFNAGRDMSGQPVDIKTIDGTGTRIGLRLGIDVWQVHEYVASTDFDAGVKVAIHPPSEPPQPDDAGIGVPVGTNAFISIRQENIHDSTQQNCRNPSDVADLNFLRGEYNYSTSACIEDCFHTNVANKCECVWARDRYPPDIEEYQNLPDCKFEHFCCEQREINRPLSQCIENCSSQCNVTKYSIVNSYSQYPAKYAVRHLTQLFEPGGVSADLEAYFRADYLSVNVYYESLNVERQETSSSYSVVALLSDIGGQLGLFLGISVISILEFVTWLMDEIKDRLFGINDRKIRRYKMCCHRKSHSGEMDVKVDDIEANDSHTPAATELQDKV